MCCTKQQHRHGATPLAASRAYLKLCRQHGGGSCENAMGRAGFSTHRESRGSRPAVLSASAAAPRRANATSDAVH
jgi:hypothetical protein